MALIKGHRGRHIRCGFALQLVTVRYLGCFLADPLEVPNEVLDVVAAQLQIEDPSCVKRYTERDKTRLEHTWEIAKAFGLKDFASAEAELAGKVRAHAWNTTFLLDSPVVWRPVREVVSAKARGCLRPCRAPFRWRSAVRGTVKSSAETERQMLRPTLTLDQERAMPAPQEAVTARCSRASAAGPGPGSRRCGTPVRGSAT